jgi:hypothetical protein
VRQEIFIAGIVVIIVGVLIAGDSLTLTSDTESISNPATGCQNRLAITPPTVFGGSESMSWAGAPSGFSFSVAKESGSSCSLGDIVATGSGTSGSVSFSVSAGTTYVVNASGNTAALPVSLSYSGVTLILLAGIAVAVVGAVLAFVGYVMRDRPRRARAPPPAPKSILPPLARQESEVPTYVPPVRQPAAATEPTGPVFFKPDAPQPGAAEDSANAPKAGGQRAWTKCKACGTMNEPWLHNCRFCKRALETTEGGS